MSKPTRSIFDFFKKEEPKKVDFSEVQTVDGITLFYEGDLAVGTPVFVLDADNNQLPAPEGDFQVTIDGNVFVISVDVNGVVASMEQVMSGDPEPEPAPHEDFVSKKDFDTIVQKIIEDADQRIAEKVAEVEEKFNQKFEALSTKKDNKFKNDPKKVDQFKSVTVREILTKK